MIDLSQQKRRLGRAADKGQELADAIQSWQANQPFAAEPVIHDDRGGWELRLRINEEPDLEAWATIFGEGLHHLRSTLNNAVTAIGLATGNTEKQLKKLQFPIANDEKAWKGNTSRIGSLPQPYQDLIESVQPFRSQNGETIHALSLLVELSNQDKHALQIEADIDSELLSHDFQVEFESPKDAKISTPPDLTVCGDGLFEDGAVVIRHNAKGARIARVRGGHYFQARVVVKTEDGTSFGVTWALAAMCTQVDGILKALEAVET